MLIPATLVTWLSPPPKVYGSKNVDFNSGENDSRNTSVTKDEIS